MNERQPTQRTSSRSLDPASAGKEDEARRLGPDVSRLLRALDLGGASGLVLDAHGHVLAASAQFVGHYCQGRVLERPVPVGELGLSDALGDQIAHALRARADCGACSSEDRELFAVEGLVGAPRVVVVQVPVEAAAAEPVLAGASDDPPAPRILLVEDDELVRSQAVRALARENPEILAVASAREALDAVEAGAHFDLLVTDVVMPGMSGPELAEELATLQCQLAVLFVSGYADGRLVEPGLSGAPRAFLAKPHTPAELCDAVRTLWSCF